MISRPTLGCIHWWKFVYTELWCHAVRMSFCNVAARKCCDLIFLLLVDFKLCVQKPIMLDFNLLVFLVKPPTIEYDGVIIEGDTAEIHLEPKTVTCALKDAGPPLPEILELVVLEGSDDVNGTSTENHSRDNMTCSWDYRWPLTTVVKNITGKVRKALFLFLHWSHTILVNLVPFGRKSIISHWHLSINSV